jgi:hypothetical protein
LQHTIQLHPIEHIPVETIEHEGMFVYDKTTQRLLFKFANEWKVLASSS